MDERREIQLSNRSESTHDLQAFSGRTESRGAYIPAISGPPTQHELAVYQTMAANAEKSNMYNHLGDHHAIMTVMLIARELGIPPMAAINKGINCIQGNLEISARILTALIRKAGHRLNIIESNDQVCIIEGIRRDTGERLKTSYSVEEAKKAGIARPNSGWSKNPKDMCFARAASRLARQLFSDIITMGYIEGEISERISDERPQDIQITPQIEDENTIIIQFLEQFDKEDQDEWKNYINTVSEKYEWTKRYVIEIFQQDLDGTVKKFNTWRKRKKTDSQTES